MSPSELIELIKTLKDAGVAQFKHGDLELSFNAKIYSQAAEPQPARKDLKPVSLEIPPKEPEIEVPHIIQQMRSVFKASDEELVDQLFPLPKEDEASA